MRHYQCPLIRLLAALAILSHAISMIPAAGAEVCHIEVLKGRYRRAVSDSAKGRLIVIDREVMFSPSARGHDNWTIDIPASGGHQIRAQGGRWDGWFLTADEMGNVYLAPRAERGSVWRRQINTVGGWNLVMDEPGKPTRSLVVEDRPSTLTDRDGVKHVVYSVRLRERGKGLAEAELHAPVGGAGAVKSLT